MFIDIKELSCLNKLSWLEITDAIIIILVMVQLLNELFAVYKQGKLIVKCEGGKVYIIFWIWMLFLFILLLYGSIRNYMNVKKYGFNIDRDINQVLMGIFWIEFSSLNLIRSSRGTEIREKGIYKNGFFCKWHRIRSFYWTSSTTVKFEINSFLKFNRSLEITIKGESKTITDEILQRYIL